jgi:ribosomal protein S4E
LAKATLNAAESGSVIRGKINDNFTELYNQAEVVASVSIDTTLDATHGTVKVDASGGAKTITLPTAAGISGKIYRIKKSDSSANTVTIDGNASETINGATTVVISYQNSCASVQSDDTNWNII